MNGGEVVFNIRGNNKDAKEKIEETGQAAEDAGKKVSDSIKSIVSALALAKGVDFLTDITKQCIQAYADFEQLAGGVETLFGDASATIKENAANAFSTVGLSANQYMETVTGFSASLIASLDGDTAAAAEKADRAIQDMSDNANKMGSDIQSIQNAYQGFAKQNYTLLDNLKLGYGGTKQEMERLLADAQAISGIKYDISSYADIIDAIGVIQDKMDITGTTAKEAATTISGSIASMKAAWQNLLTGIADPEQSVAQLTTQLTDAIATVEKNVMPRLTEIFSNMGTTISELASGVLPMIPQAITALLPSVVDGLGSILDAVISNGADLAAAIIDYLPKFVDSVGEITGGLAPVLLDALTTIANSISENADEIVESIIDNLVDFLQKDFPGVSTAAAEQAKKIILALVHGIVDHAPELAQAIPEIVSTLVVEFINYLPQFVEMGTEICNAIAEGIVNYDWAGAIAALNNGMADILDTAQKNVQVALDNIFSGGTLYGGDINNVESTDFIKNMRSGTDVLVETVDECTARWREAYAAGRTEIEGTLYEPRQISHRSTDNPLVAEMSDYAASLEAQANEWAKSANNAAQTVTQAGETLDSALGDLENKYAIHQVSEEQYWARRKAILEKYRDESDAEWWKLYDQVTDHYDKLAKTEADAAKKAAKEAADAAAKAEKEKNDAIKKSVEDTFRELETEQLENGYDKEWLLEKENEFIETLDHDSDLYKDYHLKLLRTKESYNDQMAKETDKAADAERKAMEKLVKSVENAQEKLSDSLQQSGSDIFKTESLTDTRTGTTVQKKSLDIKDFEKKIEAKKKLSGKIAELLDAGVSDELVRELLKLDPVDALQFASQLLANPQRLDRIKKDKEISDRIAEMVTGASEDYKALGMAAGEAFGEGFVEALGEDWQDKIAQIVGDETMYKGVLAGIGGFGAMQGMINNVSGGIAAGQAVTVNVKGIFTDEDGRTMGTIVNRDNERAATSAGV